MVRADEGRIRIGRWHVAESISASNDCLDIGKALGSLVSLDYRDRAPFEFTGTIDEIEVRYLQDVAS